jgi:ABC-type branched-subunit amino acid transport system substrate-binding protein
MAFSVRFGRAAEVLKVGVLVPRNLPQGESYLGGADGGAILAALDINASGGINIGGTTYYIELVIEDEHAMPLDEGAARTATLNLLTAGCRFIIGGFRTEVTDDIIAVIKGWNDMLPDHEKVIYFINGASTDELISNTVGADYNSYWWLFRINPINSTMLFKNLLGYLQGYLIPYKLAPMYCGNVSYGCLAEDLAWTVGICQYLQYMGLGPNATFKYCGRTPSGTTNFVPFLEEAAAKGVRLLIIAYTLPDSEYLIEQYRAGKYPFLIVGIDVFGQTAAWPYMTDGACEYEIFEDFSGTRTPITPMAVEFWDHFVGNFSLPAKPPAWPIYTAWGAYNGFLTLKNALEATDSLNSTELVQYLETSETPVLNGIAKFTTQHDVYSIEYGPTWPYGYTRAMMVQWVKKGDLFVKEVVCPIDRPYSTDTLIPSWVLWPDINCDGSVDMADISIMIDAFMSTEGSPNWNPKADVNDDGSVDMADISVAIDHFMEKYP